MKTLQVALRVREREAALAFYAALGYEVVGEVPESPIGHLTMIKLPADEYVTVELVHDPSSAPPTGSGISHLAVQVEDLDTTIDRLRAAGVEAGEIEHPGPELATATVVDPDGNRIELVQWPPGHAAGMTSDDWIDHQEARP